MADRGANIQSLQDDIDLYQTLLNSLEDADGDDEEEKLTYMEKLRDLKEQYNRLASVPRPQASTAVPNVDGSGDDAPSWSFADLPPAGERAVTLPTRKRDRSFLSVGDADSSRSNKSRRVSPENENSPALSAADSIDSNYFNDPEWNDILGGEWNSDLVRQNRDYLKEQEVKKRQQEEDERFARQLQEEWSQAQEPGPSSQPPRPASQNQSQSLFRPNGSFVMPPPSQRNELNPSVSGHARPRDEPTVLIDDDDEDDDIAFVSRDDWNTRFPSSASSRTMPGSFGTDWSPAPAGSSVYGHQPSYGYTPQMTSMERIRAMAGNMVSAGRGVLGLDPETLMALPMSRHLYPEVDPRETQEEIKQLLQHIRPDDDLNAAEELPQTEGLKVQLMPHQLKGVAWMKMMEEGSNKGGILADDMGLGKTLQTIAVMLERPPDPDKHRPTLIVAPVALLEQWKREFVKLVQRSHQPTTVVVHGSAARKAWQDIARFDVVLTSYGTLASELKRLINWEEKLKRNPAARKDKKDECPLLSDKSKFRRVILDEAQAIKNKSTKTAQAAYRLQAEYRWCLSGTPMQNRVEEIYSLIKFCRIAPFNNERKFNADIAAPLRQSGEQAKTRGMEKLQALLKAILLRRTKKSEIDGKPILQLPEKHTIEERAIFDKDQLQFYQALEKSTQIQFNKYVQQGRIGQNYSKALVLLLRLRQCCCSPQLITNASDFVTDSGIEGIDMIANAKQLPTDVIRRIKNQEETECPICMDAVENPTIFFPCGHALCTDCFSRMVDGVAMQAGDDIKCPHCRARIDPRKITDLKSFNEAFDENGNAQAATDDTDEGEDDSATDSDDSESDISDSDNGGDLKDFIVPDDEATDSDDEELDLDENPKMKDKEQATKKAMKGKKKRKGKKKKKDQHVNLAQLRKEGVKSKAAKSKYLRQLSKIYQPCAKIDRLLALLQEIRDRGEDEKTIVFSSFTSFLDLIEVPLRRNTDLKNYERYDGSMTAKDRNAAVLRFTDDPNCNIILVSLKAGNAGLNLTAANHVVILDPFWNPFVEYQAADRSHRIGQQREVTVHRILIGEQGVDHAAEPERIFTVEDRILQLQNKKKQLVESALDENASSSVGRLGTRELGYLFGLNQMPAQHGA